MCKRIEQEKSSTTCIRDTLSSPPAKRQKRREKDGKNNQLRIRDLANMSGEKFSDGLSMTKDEEVGETRFTDGTHNLIAAQDQLKRGLKSRHIQFLALGGA